MNFRMCLAIACGAALLAACAPKGQSDAATETQANAASADNPLGPETIKASDGTPVRVSLFRYYALNALKKDPEDLTDAERKEALNSLVNLQLLADVATKKGLQNERTIAVELKLQRMQLLARHALNRYVTTNPPTESEIAEVYKTVLPTLGGTQYKARMILVATEADAKAIIASLDKGADFAELAKKKSTDPTAAQGGELGWFTPTSMPQAFADATKSMKVGEHSAKPVQTQYGWHVILLEDEKAAEPPTLAEVHDQLADAVSRKKAEAYLQSLHKNGTPSTKQ